MGGNAGVYLSPPYSLSPKKFHPPLHNFRIERSVLPPVVESRLEIVFQHAAIFSRLTHYSSVILANRLLLPSLWPVF